jgi:hypothetical protein
MVVDVVVRPRLGLLVTALAGGVAVAASGCGPGAALTGDDPAQAVSSALQAAQTTPLVMDISGSLSLDSSGLQNLPASIQPALTQIGSGGSLTGRLTQASSSRRELDLTAAGHTVNLVAYDGKGFVRVDGGAWMGTSATLPASPRVSASALSTVVADLGFADQGQATDLGQSTEHYHAPLTAATLAKVIDDLAASMSATSSSQLQNAVTLITPFVTLSGGAADVWVSRSGGGLVEASVSGSFSVDLGAMGAAAAALGGSGASGQALPSGTLSGSLHLDLQVSSYGGAVSVTEPSASATLPTPASGGSSRTWYGLLPVVPPVS